MEITISIRTIRLAGALVAGAALLGIAAIAGAQPVTTDIIKGCVNNQNQRVRIINAGQNCITSGEASVRETAVNWNAQGIQGIQGLKGDKGDKGDTGAQGPAGLSNVELVRSVTPVGANAVGAIPIQSCPAGKRLIAGTVNINESPDNPLAYEANFSLLNVRGWILNAAQYGAVWSNTLPRAAYVHSQLICATPS